MILSLENGRHRKIAKTFNSRIHRMRRSRFIRHEVMALEIFGHVVAVLESLEKDAREAERGLYADPHPVQPWVYRNARHRVPMMNTH